MSCFRSMVRPGLRVLPLVLGFALAAPQGPAAASSLLAPAGYVVVHAMGADGTGEGQGPVGPLAQPRGTDASFLGTNFFLGDIDQRCDCAVSGTVWRLQSSGKFAKLHTFTGPDGFAPASGLVQGDDRAWYGVTAGGGAYDGGVAFRITTDGASFEVLHSFGGPANDGRYFSYGALAKGPDGSFYGATMQGAAHGLGAVFRMAPDGTVTVLHAFAGAPGDGANPRGGLLMASDGNLYGTTQCGSSGIPAAGCGGTAYRITPAGVFTLLHSFDGKGRRYHPIAGLAEIGGVLYGTTSQGGPGDFGTVFSLDLAGGHFTKLHDFAGGVMGSPANTDGARPLGALLPAPDGNLYGTTSQGGANTTTQPKGDGTLFRIGTSGSFTVLGNFGASATDGVHPMAALMLGKDGMIYGTADNGGANANGVIFKFPVPAR